MKRKETFRFFPILITVLAPVLALIVPIAAQAQQCEAVGEQILTLKEPTYGTPMVWSTSYGHEGMDEITDLVEAYIDSKGEDGIILAGNYTKSDKDKTTYPFIARLDKNGKVIWETRSGASSAQNIRHIYNTSTGYAAIGEAKEGKKKGFYIGNYAKNGKRLGVYPYFAEGYKVVGKALIETKDKEAYLVAAVMIDKNDSKKRDTVIYRISKGGTILWQRRYSLGMQTEPNNIQTLSDGRYMMTGQIEQEDGRMGGWMVNIGDDGAISWQRQYPRGSDASLDNVIFLKDEQAMIVSGVVKPLTGTVRSGWIMKVDSSGTPVWQRYYSGAYQYDVGSVIAEPDGRLSVLLSALPLPRDKKPTERPKSHASLLTLSPRGNILDYESYTDGYYALGVKMIEDDEGHRIVAGVIQENMLDGMDDNSQKGSTLNGWVFSATRLPSYQDPCKTTGY